MKKVLISFFILIFLFQSKNFSNECGVKQLLQQALEKQVSIACDFSAIEVVQKDSLEEASDLLDYLDGRNDDLSDILVFLQDVLDQLEDLISETTLSIPTKASVVRIFSLLRKTQNSQFSSIDTLAESLSKVDVIFSLIETSSRLAAELDFSLEECEIHVESVLDCIDMWDSILDDVCPTPTHIVCPFP
ncbi:hypothetical protein ACFLYA_01675 [Candidatus Dependentiae bacterium]